MPMISILSRKSALLTLDYENLDPIRDVNITHTVFPNRRLRPRASYWRAPSGLQPKSRPLPHVLPTLVQRVLSLSKQQANSAVFPSLVGVERGWGGCRRGQTHNPVKMEAIISGPAFAPQVCTSDKTCSQEAQLTCCGNYGSHFFLNP